MKLPALNSPVLNGLLIQIANFFQSYDLNEEDLDKLLKRLKYMILKKKIIDQKLSPEDDYSLPLYIDIGQGLQEVSSNLDNEVEFLDVYELEDGLINEREINSVIKKISMGEIQFDDQGNMIFEDEDDDEEYLQNLLS